MEEKDFQDGLKTQASALLDEGKSVEEVQAWIEQEKITYAEGKPQESEISTDATVTQEDTDLASDDSSSELFYPEFEKQRDSIQKQFDKGVIKGEHQREAYDKYHATGDIDATLLGYIPEDRANYDAEQAANAEQTEQHNLEADLRREAIARATPGGFGVLKALDDLLGTDDKAGDIGIADLAIEVTSGLYEGTESLVRGTADFLLATGFSAHVAGAELWDPELAEKMKEDPELRAQLFDEISAKFDFAGQDFINQFDRTATDAALEGDFAEFGHNILLQTAQAAPSLVATASGIGGMAVLGLSAAGGSYTETIAKAPDSSILSIYGTSLLKGGYEFASEYATRGILKKAGLIFGKGGEAGINSYSKGIVKEVFKDFTSEGASEAAASLAGYITDKLVHDIEPPEDMWKLLADEFIVGGFLGGGASLIGSQNQGNPSMIRARLESQYKVGLDVQEAETLSQLTKVAANAKTQKETDLVNKDIAVIRDSMKQRQTAHNTVVEDFTLNEANSLIGYKQEAAAAQELLKTREDLTDKQKEFYEAKIVNNIARAEEVYSRVEKFPDAVAEASNKKGEITKERDEIKLKEVAMKKAENPNPVSTQKLNERKEELTKQEKEIDQALDTFRPAVATKDLVGQIEKLDKRNENIHKDNIKLLESQNASKVEIANEVADYNNKKEQLTQAKGDLEGLVKEQGQARVVAGEKLTKTLSEAEGVQSETQTKEAKAVLKGGKAIVNSAIALSEDATSVTKAEHLAKAIKDSAIGIGEYLVSVQSPYGATVAIKNVIGGIQARIDLTDAQKATLTTQLRKELPTNVDLISNPLDASFLDDSDLQAIDDAQHQQDIDAAINGGFQEATSNVKDEQELDVVDIEAKAKIEADEALDVYDGYVERTIDWIANGPWKSTHGGVIGAIKKIPAKRLHEIIAQSLVGNATEDVKFDNTPGSNVLTRIGREAYEYLKGVGEDVSEFEVLPDRLVKALNQKEGRTADEILKRAINYRSLDAGGSIIQIVGGKDGFFHYEKGYPRLELKDDGSTVNKRPQDLKIEVLNKEALDSIELDNGLKLVDALENLRKNGDITLAKTWKNKDKAVPMTIHNRIAFDELVGYENWQELLQSKTILQKSPDFKKSDVTTIRVSAPINKETESKERKEVATKLFRQYTRGGAIRSQDVSDTGATSRTPQYIKPGIWESFWHSSGLGAISNASPKIKKKFATAVNALKTLTNASQVPYSINQRALKIYGVLQEKLFTYKEDNATIQSDKVEDFWIIQDIARGIKERTFYAMHRFDFRGRLYNAMPYLNFQANKAAKALFKFGGKPKAIGERGFANLVKQIGDYFGGSFYLMKDGSISFDEKSGGVKIDSKAMTDKDRFRVGMKLVEKLANVAADPLSEESIAFLSDREGVPKGDVGDLISLSTEMLELTKHVKSGKPVTSFETNFILWNDATVSGAQNLAMLTGDSVTLSLVNGLDTYLKRDLYTKVGKRVFDNIREEFSQLPTRPWTTEDENQFNSINEQLDIIKKEAESGVVYKDEDIQALIDKYKEIVDSPEFNVLATKYWNASIRQKKVRNLAKGPVMTGFYSAGPWVMAESTVKEFQGQPGFEQLNQGLAYWLTKKLKASTSEIAPGPKLAQKTFNRIGGFAAENGQVMELDGLINDFPFLQEYLYYKELYNKDTGKKIDSSVKVPNPDNTSQRFNREVGLNARIGDSFLSVLKTQSASAPNITHFLDGQIVASQFTDEAVSQRHAATIHDNFGTHPSDADAQVQSVLDNMADMYTGAPMERIIRNALQFDPALAEEEVKRYRTERAKLKDENGIPVPVADPNAIRKNKYAISSAGGTTRIDNWPTTTEKEAKDEAHIDRLKETFKNADSDASALNETTQPVIMPTAPVAEATTSNVDNILNKHDDALKSGDWVLLDLSKGTLAEEESLIKSIEAKGLEVKAIPKEIGKVAVKASDKIMSNSEAKTKIDTLTKLLNNNYTYKGSTKSKIDQDTREILDATRLDFGSRGHLFSESQIDELIFKLDNLIKRGKKSQGKTRKEIEDLKEVLSARTVEYIEETSDVKVEGLTTDLAEKKANERRSYAEGFMKGKFFTATGNQDFYGLLYDLLPTKSGRDAAKLWQKENITDVLEDASYNSDEMAHIISNNSKAVAEKYGITDKIMAKESGIIVNETNIQNGLVVKIFNHIQNPNLHDALIEGGYNMDILNEISDYVNADKNLKGYSNAVPSIFAGAKAFLNQKSNEHGLKGFSTTPITKPEAGPRLDLLNKVYDGNIPAEAAFTPFTEVTEQGIIDIEKSLKLDSSGQFYTVMKGNIKGVEKRGEFKGLNQSIQRDIHNFATNTLRQVNHLDFARNASAVFSPTNLKAMEAAYGKDWGDSMRDSLRAILTGKNRTASLTKNEQRVTNWVNQSVAGVMFLNTRSMALQMLSTPNFIIQEPAAFAKGVSDPKAMAIAYRVITDSAWFGQRGKGKTDINLESVFEDYATNKGSAALNKFLQKGYVLTKWGDQGAILMGGIPVVAGLMKQGLSEEVALKRFIALAKEVQQSVSPERVGAESRGLLGRVILTFSSVNQQYNRVMNKNFTDLFAKDNTPAGRAKNVGTIIYYGGIQNVAFNALQQWIFSALDLEDEKDEEKLKSIANGALDTIMRGSGIVGALASVAKNLGFAVYKYWGRRDAGDKIAVQSLSAVPQISHKYRLLRNTFRKPYKLSNGFADVPDGVIQASSGLEFVTSFPATRLVKKWSALSDIMAKDLEESQKIMRVWGYDRYTLDATVSKKGEQLEAVSDDSEYSVEVLKLLEELKIENK